MSIYKIKYEVHMSLNKTRISNSSTVIKSNYSIDTHVIVFQQVLNLNII